MLHYLWQEPLFAALTELEPPEFWVKVANAEAVLMCRLDALSGGAGDLKERQALNHGLFALRALRRSLRAA
jgi:hypothetical protein